MSPILQCFPHVQAAIVEKARVHSEDAKSERFFFTRATADDLRIKYGKKTVQERSRNFKTIQTENQIIAAVTGDGCTPYKVAKKIGRDEMTVKKIMIRLAETGRLNRFESGRKTTQGKTYFYSQPSDSFGANGPQVFGFLFDSILPEGITVCGLRSALKKHEKTIKKELGILIEQGKVYSMPGFSKNKRPVTIYKKTGE
jgi:hypothetical protein